MTTDRSAQLAQHFPALEDIPADYRLGEQVHQRHSLVAGRLIEWNGPSKTVLSPVCTRDAGTGEVRQVEIGSYPVMGGPRAMPRSTPRWPPMPTAAANGRR